MTHDHENNARAGVLKEQMLAAARREGSASAACQAAFAEWARLRQSMVADPSSGFTAEAFALEAEMLATAVGEQAALRLGERLADDVGADAAVEWLTADEAAELSSDELHVRATALRHVLGDAPVAH